MIQGVCESPHQVDAEETHAVLVSRPIRACCYLPMILQSRILYKRNQECLQRLRIPPHWGFHEFLHSCANELDMIPNRNWVGSTPLSLSHSLTHSQLPVCLPVFPSVCVRPPVLQMSVFKQLSKHSNNDC